MANQYRVTERSFINGRLYEVGELVNLHIDSPGANLELVKKPAQASLPDAGSTATGGDSVPTPPGGTEAYHVGAGRWAIRQVGGERVGDWVGTREEAEAKAAGMNAVDPDLADKDDTSLPDA